METAIATPPDHDPVPANEPSLAEVADRDFVCFCGQDWWYHNRAHSDFQLMTRIARHRKVLLINSIGMRVPTLRKTTNFWSKVRRKLGSMARFVRRPRKDLPNFHVMSPIALPISGTGWLSRLSTWWIRSQVRVVAWWLGIRDPAVFATVPTAWPVLRKMRYSSLLYNRSDKHSAFGEANHAFIVKLERELMSAADAVLYVSRTLMDEERDLADGKAVFLDHGVDLARFSMSKTAPPLLSDVPTPRIGFFGGLRDHLVDFELLAYVAKEIPEAQLVLIGDATSDMSGILAHDNVHWLGYRDQTEIPSIGTGFDIGLMPYRDTEWIRNCNPIKLKEYLALGLDVVSTDFPEAHRYAAAVHVAASKEQFVATIRQVLGELAAVDDREHRRTGIRKLVATDSWDNRTHELLVTAAGGAS